MLPGKPSFTRADLLGATVQVGGESEEGDTLYQIHVTLLQDADGQEEPCSAQDELDNPARVWAANFPSDGFTKGPCVVVGHEIQLVPHFSAHTWVEYMVIE